MIHIDREAFHQILEPLECPKCGKYALVHQSANELFSIWYVFHQSISKTNINGFSWLSSTARIFVLVRLLAIDQSRKTFVALVALLYLR
jgi:hypothetical protein